MAKSQKNFECDYCFCTIQTVDYDLFYCPRCGKYNEKKEFWTYKLNELYHANLIQVIMLLKQRFPQHDFWFRPKIREEKDCMLIILTPKFEEIFIEFNSSTTVGDLIILVNQTIEKYKIIFKEE
jgi:hypothetical protein